MKIAALWLGPGGVGLLGIFNTTTDTATMLTGLELRQTGVRELTARDSGKPFTRRLSIVRRWSLWAGLAGAFILSTLAFPLSAMFFGNHSQWWAFLLLGFCVFANAIVNGERAVLQATDWLRRLAGISVKAAVAGLVISIFLFRFYSLDGVVWSCVAYAGATLAVSLWGHPKGGDNTLNSVQAWHEGLPMAKLGVFMAAAAFIANAMQMMFIAWLANIASIDTVGHYQAAMTLIARYTGVLFASMGVEYYPRLTANCHSRRRMVTFVNHEIVFIQSILMPCVAVFVLLAPLIVRILYSDSFLVIVDFISWGILAMSFRALSFSMAYTIPALGRGRLYLIVESCDAVLGVILFIAAYHFAGLDALGIAYLLWNMAYAAVIFIVCNRLYGLRLKASTWGWTAFSVGIGLAAILVRMLYN